MGQSREEALETEKQEINSPLLVAPPSPPAYVVSGVLSLPLVPPSFFFPPPPEDNKVKISSAFDTRREIHVY